MSEENVNAAPGENESEGGETSERAKRPYFSVIIVGAGPTGLALGNLLGLYGLDALLVERNADLSADARAISLDDEGLRVCQALGLTEEVRGQLLYDLEVQYLSGRRLLSKVAPTSWRHGFPLFSTFHQPLFEATLLAGLKRFPTIAVQFGLSLESFEQGPEGVVVAVRGRDGEVRQLECAYLLACDGAKSTVRRALQIPMQGTARTQRWLVVDSIDDPDMSTAIRFFCNPDRPAVTIPSPDHRRRWEFMLLPGENAEKLARPEKARELIRQAGGPAQPKITRSAIYTFHAVTASTFQSGRVFLLGDAAHLMPPFGGQGMNCGLRDAHNLAWKLRLVMQEQANPALLATYTEERLAHVREMIKLSRFLGAIITPTDSSIAHTRDALFSLVNALPAVRDYLTQAKIKPAPRYKQGFFWSGGVPANRVLAGRMLPQPEINTSNGQHYLLDDLLGSGFALLRLNSTSHQPFADFDVEDQPVWRALAPRLLTASDELHTALAVREDLFLLVRPDRYIYAAFPPTSAALHACAQTLAARLF